MWGVRAARGDTSCIGCWRRVGCQGECVHTIYTLDSTQPIYTSTASPSRAPQRCMPALFGSCLFSTPTRTRTCRRLLQEMRSAVFLAVISTNPIIFTHAHRPARPKRRPIAGNQSSLSSRFCLFFFDFALDGDSRLSGPSMALGTGMDADRAAFFSGFRGGFSTSRCPLDKEEPAMSLPPNETGESGEAVPRDWCEPTCSHQ